MARGRKPGAVLTFVRGGKTPPPDNMPAFAVKLWQKITAELPKEHFRESDLPLLKSYCWSAWTADEAQRVLMAEGLEASAYMFTLHRNAIADMTRLAGKLRLCPSSRIRAEAADLRKTALPDWKYAPLLARPPE